MSPPPKRALLSLNLDTDAEHIQQRVNDSRHHNNSSNSPTAATTTSRSQSRDDETTRSERSSINILTKPLEHTIQKTVEGVLREEWKPAPGKKVLSSGSGALSLETQTTPLTATTTTTTSTSGNSPVVKKTIVKQNISGGNTHHHHREADSPGETVDDKYDTSDL